MWNRLHPKSKNDEAKMTSLAQAPSVTGREISRGGQAPPGLPNVVLTTETGAHSVLFEPPVITTAMSGGCTPSINTMTSESETFVGGDNTTTATASPTNTTSWTTRAIAPFDLGSPEVAKSASFLHRLILDILIFTYEVKMPDNKAKKASKAKKVAATTTSHLPQMSDRDKQIAYYLAHIVVYAICAIRQAEAANIPLNSETRCILDRDYNILWFWIIQPATKLAISPEWVFEQLYAFFSHRCNDGKQCETMLYHHADMDDKDSWSDEVKHQMLAKRIIADGVVLERLIVKASAGKNSVERAVAATIQDFGHSNIDDALTILQATEKKVWYGDSGRSLAVDILSRKAVLGKKK